MGFMSEYRAPISCLLFLGMLLMVILLPLTFSYVEYYQFGLLQRRSTGAVSLDRVYTSGRYAVGPDYTFRVYPADAHMEEMQLSVFSKGATNSSIGLEFVIDVTVTYLLKEAEVPLLHQELAEGYNKVILARMKEAIKNEAVNFEFTEFFQQRDLIQTKLEKAVRGRLAFPPALHATLDQFILGRVQIPDSVANKQLDVKIQLERNDMQDNMKRAMLERDLTSVEVNKIDLEASQVLRIANANAELLKVQGEVEAKEILEQATFDGFADMYAALGITSAKHKASLDYLRTLEARATAAAATNSETKDSVNVVYLSDSNVVKTAAAVGG